MAGVPNKFDVNIRFSKEIDATSAEDVQREVAESIAGDLAEKKLDAMVSRVARPLRSGPVSIRVENARGRRDWSRLRKTLRIHSQKLQCNINVDFNGRHFSS